MTARPDSKDVGVVGLGTMGGPMSAHLAAAGFTVRGYDVRASAVDALVQAGGRAGASALDVAASSSVVLTSLPTVAAFESVTSELAGAPAGLIVVETSTMPLQVKQRARDLLAEHDVGLLDCTLSGTGAQMRVKDVAVYASGEPDAIASCREVFAAFSRSQFDVGPFGNGTKVKMIANHLVTIHNVSAAEALLLARRAGLDLQVVFDAVTDGAGTSRMLEVRGPLMMAGDYSDATMRVETYQKDIDIITGFARDLRCPTPLFAASAQLYLAALAQGRSDEDTASVFAVLEGMLES
ncbi:MAG: NAD(P)-dependent oxidoreductase [Acidimicrobiales bacterium]